MKLLLLIFSLNCALAKTHEVLVSSNIFTPSSLTIEAGDTVRWINTGGGHNVRASDNSFRCAQGCDGNGGNGNPSTDLWQAEVIFRKIGTTNYICEPHINFGMQGSITVVQPPSVTTHHVSATSTNQFIADDMTILRGDVVRFTNDGGEHNIHASDNSFRCSEGCQGDGTSTSSSATAMPWDIHLKFNEIKETPYFCDMHNNTGIIRVLTDTYFANGFE